jgi:hypothetical protein
MVLSRSVVVRPGGVHGHCWFAGEDIPAGAMIWEKGDMQYNDIDITKEELLTWEKDKRETFMALAYQVKPGVYRGTDPKKVGKIPQEEQNEYYVNHCCDGNCWYQVSTQRERKDNHAYTLRSRSALTMYVSLYLPVCVCACVCRVMICWLQCETSKQVRSYIMIMH